MLQLTDNPLILLGLFLLLSGGVIWTAFWFTQIIKNFSNRFVLSSTFVGSTILAIGTSFSELVNAIIAGFYDSSQSVEYSINSFYNITGANLLQIIFLAIVTVFVGVKLLKQKNFVEYDNFMSALLNKKILLWTLIFVETIILFLMLRFREWFKIFSVGNVNLVPMLFVLVWLFYFFITLYDKQDATEKIEVSPEKKNFVEKLSNKNFLFMGLIMWLLFAFFSYGNFFIVSKFDKVLNIPKNIGLGIVLSIITSMPEFASFYFLFKQKSYKLAVSGFLGSSLFNLTLLFLTEIISKEWIFNHKDFIKEIPKVTIWLLADITINICFFIGAINVKISKFKNKLLYKPMIFSCIIIWLYINAVIKMTLY